MVTKVLHKTLRITLTVVLTCLWSCVPISTTNSTIAIKKINYDDHNYEDYVGNVILNSNNPFQDIGGAQPLTLEFDLLTDKFENLQVRYIHCNANWTKSKIQEIEYLRSFNQFDHTSFDYSTNTKVNYIQYFFELDRPFLSGNYLIVVHRRNNKEDILLTRRMVFYKNRVSVVSKIRVSSTVKNRRTHQQIDFEMNYGGIQSPNPQRDFKVVILQNKNWNTAISDLKPTSIQSGQKKMEWNLFTGENTFSGQNQFRYLDLRTLNLRGIKVAKIDKETVPWSVYQGLDKSSRNESYRGLINDNNGRVIPGNSDPGESWLEADYANVYFTMKSERLDGRVYVTGRFNDWRRDDNNIMQYDKTNQVYHTSIRLKQGYYDYMYFVDSPQLPSYELEGSHYQTENEYDILVYYRSPGRINDEVVGFFSMNSGDFF
ncbi:MAG: DUF5103 domain-containing protein [Cytophagales bacterium]|nr:DUF5103 domain-containing protein [Cytophagales bacterium]